MERRARHRSGCSDSLLASPIFRLYIRRNPPRPFRRSSSGNFRRTHRAVGPLVEFEGGEGCRGGSTGCGCAIRFARHAPREYFNEIIEGTKNGHLYFSDEGVDIWQRGKEIAEYYHHVLEPSGEVPIVSYEPIGEPEKKALGLDWLGRDPKRDETRLSSPIFSGAVLINARFLGTWPFWDRSSLRDTAPSARFGICWSFEERALAARSWLPPHTKMPSQRSMPKSRIWKRLNDC